MKICLIMEGSYPHVTGGVSTWAQMLVSNLKQYDFVVFAIGAEKKLKSQFKYTLPDNLIEVKEIFLDEMLGQLGRYGKKLKLSRDTEENLKKLITGQKVNWDLIFNIFIENKIQNEMDFFMSINFFDILLDAYKEKYSLVPFTEFFWTVRSMLVPLFFLLKTKIPQADIYHSASTGYAGIFGAMAKYLYNKPFIVTEHGIYSREREEEIIKSSWAKGYFKDMWIKFFYNVCSASYDYADKIITLFEKNKLIQIELGCPFQKLEIIPNGIDIKVFTNNQFNLKETTNNAKDSIEAKNTDTKNVKDLEDLTSNIDLDSKENFINIGTITRVVPIKDIKTMIQSFNIVQNEVKKTNFFIMGPTEEDEEYYNECLRLAQRLGVKNLKFTGKVDTKKYLRFMDIVVLTSVSEGQPFSILEAMACKKPVVATDVGGCMELLYGREDNFGRAGIIVPVMDIDKIAKAIISLAKNDTLRKKMGENGFNRVSNLYTFDKCVNNYKRVYENVLKRVNDKTSNNKTDSTMKKEEYTEKINRYIKS